jgi:3-dehydroquinate dehydratase-2
MLGAREPDIYGAVTLDLINASIKKRAQELNVEVCFFQSNSEGSLIDAIHEGRICDGLIINPAGYGHTSVAILDAVKAIGIPAVEVHLSNIYARESFRHHTMTSSAMLGVISGFGADSYMLALDGIVKYLKERKSK